MKKQTKMTNKNKQEIKKYTYSWIYFCLMTLWAGLEAYWCGLSFEHKYSASITLPMVTISAMTGIAFLIAFINSKEEIKWKKQK